MTLDNYKLQSPEDDQDGDFQCEFCERDIKQSGFCSNECSTAYYSEIT